MAGKRELILYGKCRKNHAVHLGKEGTDGCGEYFQDSDPSSLLCGACSCHRNFHERRTLTLEIGEGSGHTARPKTFVDRGSSPIQVPQDVISSEFTALARPEPVVPEPVARVEQKRSAWSKEMYMNYVAGKLGCQAPSEDQMMRFKDLLGSAGISIADFRIWLEKKLERNRAAGAETSTRAGNN